MRKRNFLGFIVLSYLLVSSLVYAESLQDIYYLAQKNDVEFLSKMHQGDATSENYKQVRALFFPTVDLTVAYTDTVQDIVSADNAVFQAGKVSFPTEEYEFQVAQSLYNRGNWYKLQQAKVELRKIAADMGILKQDLILKSVERYFAVLSANQKIKGLLVEVSGLKDQYHIGKAKLASGLEKNTVLKKAKAAYLDAESRLSEARYELMDAQLALEEMTGQPINVLNDVKKDFPVLVPFPADRMEWVKMSLMDNPSILSQQEMLSMTEQEVVIQRSAHYPQLDFKLTHGQKNTEGTLFGGGSDVKETKMMVELTVPLFSGGATVSKVRQAYHLNRKASTDLELIKRRVKRETVKSFNLVKGSLFRVDALWQLMEASDEDKRARQKALNSGIISRVGLIDAERAFAKVSSDYQRERHTYIVNMMRLKRASGHLLEIDLKALSDIFLSKAVQISSQ